MRHKLRLELQWLGTHYGGWQAQPGVPGPPSIYEVLHAALKEATGQDGGPVPAGRTDKGVHAMQQAVTVTVSEEGGETQMPIAFGACRPAA